MEGLFNLFLLFALIYSIPFVYKFTIQTDKRILHFLWKKVLKNKSK